MDELWFLVDRARQSFRQSFRMSSMRRGHLSGSRRAHVSSPTDSTSSERQLHDAEGRPTAAPKLDSPSEEVESVTK